MRLRKGGRSLPLPAGQVGWLPILLDGEARWSETSRSIPLPPARSRLLFPGEHPGASFARSSRKGYTLFVFTMDIRLR